MKKRDEWLEKLVAELKEPVPVDPAAKARVMEAVRATARSTVSGRRPAGRDGAPRGPRVFWQWLVTARPVAVSPLGAGALIAVVCGAVLVAAVMAPLRTPSEPQTIGRASRGGPPAHPGTPDAGSGALSDRLVVGPDGTCRRPVQFVLHAAGAERVALVGDFNDWDPAATPLQPAGVAGVWSVVVPLKPGRHVYSFVVDGQTWIGDPQAPLAPAGDFGRPSSVVLVEQTPC